MSDESYDLSDEFDAPSAIAESDTLSFRFDVFIARLTSEIFGALIAFLAIVGAALVAAFLYFVRTDFEIGAVAYSLMPSLLVILLFAAASAAHFVLTLHATRRLAQVAMERQIRAQKQVEFDLAQGHFDLPQEYGSANQAI